MLNSYSFSRSERLLTKAQFAGVFNVKKRLYSRYFVLYYAQNNLDKARIGLITSKKCAKFANKRNKIRRHARESFRQHAVRSQSIDIILIAHSRAVQANSGEIQRCLEVLFQKLIKCSKAL